MKERGTARTSTVVSHHHIFPIQKIALSCFTDEFNIVFIATCLTFLTKAVHD